MKSLTVVDNQSMQISVNRRTLDKICAGKARV